MTEDESPKLRTSSKHLASSSPDLNKTRSVRSSTGAQTLSSSEKETEEGRTAIKVPAKKLSAPTMTSRSVPSATALVVP